MRIRTMSWAFLGLSLWACDAPTVPRVESKTAPEPAQADEDEERGEDESPKPPAAAADPNEACARIIAVSFKGALQAPEGLGRSEEEAKARAEALRNEIVEGADFAELASDQSDAAARVRAGAIGTFTRERWPEKHAAVEQAVFAATVGGLTPVVRAPYGYTFALRCAVEKVHTRHVLVRYAGAKNAPEDLERTREEAEALAMDVYGKAQAGESFEALARQYSEDSSAERGGDMGEVGRGLFVPPYEETAFALSPGGISAPVESVFGFHVIQRL